VAAAEIALVRTVLYFVVPSGLPQREEEHRHFDDGEVTPSGKDSS
jgi:hypothetical protein